MSTIASSSFQNATRELSRIGDLFQRHDTSVEELAPYILRCWRDLTLTWCSLTASQEAPCSNANSVKQMMEELQIEGLALPQDFSAEQLYSQIVALEESTQVFATQNSDSAISKEALTLHYRVLLQTTARLRTKLPSRYTGLRQARTVLLLLVLVVLASATAYVLWPEKPWKVAVYANTDLRGPAERLEASRGVSFDSREFTSGPSPRLYSYSATFESELHLSQATELVFRLLSDDGSRLFVDGKNILDQWKVQWAQEKEATVALEAGIHSVRLDYFQAGGEAVLSLDIYEGEGDEKKPFDRSHFHYPDKPGPQ